MHWLLSKSNYAAICEYGMSFVVNEGVQPRERCAVMEPGVDDAICQQLGDAQRNIGL